MELVKQIYMQTKSFPIEERYGLTAQIQRSAVSIPSNIAEGCGRNLEKELIQFISIAHASSYELETQIIIARELNLLSSEIFETINSIIQEVQKMLYAFKKTIISKQTV